MVFANGLIGGRCGSPFTGAWSKYHSYAYYFCRNRCGSPNVRPSEAEQSLCEFLKSISLSEAGLKLFIAFIRNSYMKRIAILQKKRSDSEGELSKLYALRQTLIEKNLSGVYSDVVFNEQNAILEEKIKGAQVLKNDPLLEKYNLEEIVKFIESKLTDLGETYKNSSQEQKKILLSSIFPSGITWNFPDISNSGISSLYQSIRAFSDEVIHVGDPTRIRTENQEIKSLLLYR